MTKKKKVTKKSVKVEIADWMKGVNAKEKKKQERDEYSCKMLADFGKLKKKWGIRNAIFVADLEKTNVTTVHYSGLAVDSEGEPDLEDCKSHIWHVTQVRRLATELDDAMRAKSKASLDCPVILKKKSGKKPNK